MSRNIEGKIVVITGASSGLGKSTARHLAKLGTTVVLGARRTNRLECNCEGHSDCWRKGASRDS